MILLNLTRNSAIPIYRQIIDQFIDLIEKKTLEAGTVLPASRRLADKLGVDRTTVYRAYQELNALGYVDSQPGSYTIVRKRPEVTVKNQVSSRGIINWDKTVNASSNRLFNIFRNYSPEQAPHIPPGLINLSPLDLDHRVFPVDDFRRCMNQVLVNDGAQILRYGEYAGYKPLREYIAHRLQIHGISISAGEVLITNGAQQAIELVLNLLTAPGTKVAIETPTYANVIPLLQYHQIEIREILMVEEGLDLNHLENLLQKNPPAFVYTIPNFHNPTGITTGQAHREALLSLCEKYRVPIVEDGFEEEMKYFGKVVLPIKSMDKNRVVIYLGTFSKVLFPGIRIGWIAAEKECIRRLTAIKRFTDLSTGTVVQAAVAAFCRQGYYDLHLKRMHRIFRKRMQIALNALRENLPENVSWTKPDGGYTIWVKLARSYTGEAAFKNSLVKHGVLVSPGEYYFHGSSPHQYFRLSIASLNEEEIQEGMLRLGKALRDLYSPGVGDS
jgi:DNA-binding transcriptional MocR family regulator